MLTCYDKVKLNRLVPHRMCYKCCNYLNEPIKSKTQWEMGKQFRCMIPSVAVDYDEESESKSVLNSKNHSVSDSEGGLSDKLSTDEEHIVLSPPRKTTRGSPNRITRQTQGVNHPTSLNSPYRKKRSGRQRQSIHKSIIDYNSYSASESELELHNSQGVDGNTNLRSPHRIKRRGRPCKAAMPLTNPPRHGVNNNVMHETARLQSQLSQAE